MKVLYRALGVGLDVLQGPLLLGLRAWFGITLFTFGLGKLADLGSTEAFFAELDVPAPALNAIAVGLVETAGGLALALGWGSRVAAVPVAIVMLTAILTAHGSDPFLLSKPFPYFATAVLVLVFGPGRYSIEEHERRQAERRADEKRYAAIEPVAAKPVVIALPNRDFDITEVVVPWTTLRRAGLEVRFATPDGQPGSCDPTLLRPIVLGHLGALPENVGRYRALEGDPAFRAPLTYESIDPDAYSALVLPGGHAPGMKPYLESEVLQTKARAFLEANHPVGAICHGVLVLARTKGADGTCVLAGRKVTALLKSQELGAHLLTFWKLGRHYRTYPETVEDEVRAGGALFDKGPALATYANPFVLRDGNLVTARWPGDATAFADAVLELIRENVQTPMREA